MRQFKEKVKALSDKKGWSQDDLAREIEVSLSTSQRGKAKGANPIHPASRELKKLFKEAGIGSEENKQRLLVLD